MLILSIHAYTQESEGENDNDVVFFFQWHFAPFHMLLGADILDETAGVCSDFLSSFNSWTHLSSTVQGRFFQHIIIQFNSTAFRRCERKRGLQSINTCKFKTGEKQVDGVALSRFSERHRQSIDLRY